MVQRRDTKRTDRPWCVSHETNGATKLVSLFHLRVPVSRMGGGVASQDDGEDEDTNTSDEGLPVPGRCRSHEQGSRTVLPLVEAVWLTFGRLAVRAEDGRLRAFFLTLAARMFVHRSSVP